MKKMLFLLAISFSFNAHADDSLYLGLFTDHMVSGKYNEKNNLIAYGYDGLNLAYFNNSYGNDSFAVSKELPMKPYGDFRFGVKYGLVTGYEKGAIPFLAPWVEYNNVGVVVFGSAVMGYLVF